MNSARRSLSLQTFLQREGVKDAYEKHNREKSDAFLKGSYNNPSESLGRSLDFTQASSYPAIRQLIECWIDAQQKKEVGLWYLFAKAIVAYELFDLQGNLRLDTRDVLLEQYKSSPTKLENSDTAQGLARAYISGFILQPLLEHLMQSEKNLSYYLTDKDPPITPYIETQEQLPNDFEAILNKTELPKEAFKNLELFYLSNIDNAQKSIELEKAIADFFAFAEKEAIDRLENELISFQEYIHSQPDTIKALKQTVLNEVYLVKNKLPEKETGDLPHYTKVRKLELLARVCRATAQDTIDADQYSDLIDEVDKQNWKRIGKAAIILGAVLLAASCIALAILTGGIAIPFMLGTIGSIVLGVSAIGIGAYGGYKAYTGFFKHTALENAMINVKDEVEAKSDKSCFYYLSRTFF